jgi:adenylate cyclase
VQLDPESCEVNHQAGSIFYRQGKLNEAARYFEKCVALDDADLGSPAMLISCYAALGDTENTRRTARRALARAETAISLDRSNGYAMNVGVGALAALGEAVRAKEWMRRALLIDPANLIMRYNFACALARSLDDRQAALDMLGPVLEHERGRRLVSTALTDPDFARLRDAPRFQAMIAAAEARLAAAPAEGVEGGHPSQPS